jgi:hypothetical protein
MNDLTSTAGRDSLDRFVRRIVFLWKSVCALGPFRGLAYWRIMLACEKDPKRVLEWACLCEHESEQCKLRGDLGGHWAMDSWAKQLRHQYKAYISANALDDR